MDKPDLALKNQQGLICHKPKPNQTKPWEGYESNYSSPIYGYIVGKGYVL